MTQSPHAWPSVGHPRRRVGDVERAAAASTGADGVRPLDGATFAVVDVETSGLSPKRDRVLQVAVVAARADGTVVESWSSYVRPRSFPFVRLGPRHVHGIRRRDLRHAPRPADVLAELDRRLDGRVLTAHGIGFDVAFLRSEAQRAGQRFSPRAQVCTLTIARRLDPGNTHSHRLGDLCARYAIPLDNAHDALADATATAALLPHLIAATGATTVGELEELSRRSGRAPGAPCAPPGHATAAG